MPDRSEALALLERWVENENLRKHMLAVEAAVRSYARLRGADEELWGMAGLLHDTRVAGWSWSGGDRALNPQIRLCIHEFGAIYPNFQAALSALEAVGV